MMSVWFWTFRGWQLFAWINRSLSITVLTLIWQSVTWCVRVSWTCCSWCCKQIWLAQLPLENWVWMSTDVLPCSQGNSWRNSLLQPHTAFTIGSRQDLFIRRNHSNSKLNQPSHSSAEEQFGWEQSSFICRTSNSPYSPGSLPGSGNKKVGSWCHWQTPCTECWVKLGREGHARSEFRHVYITAQDISQSLAKLLKFPGSRVAECWKEAQAFTFSSLLSLPLLCSGV